MAVLICLADVVETKQGDPRLPISLKNQKKVVSYGHRLVTRWANNAAAFQWGNAKLYRRYFQDYTTVRPQAGTHSAGTISRGWLVGNRPT